MSKVRALVSGLAAFAVYAAIERVTTHPRLEPREPQAFAFERTSLDARGLAWHGVAIRSSRTSVDLDLVRASFGPGGLHLRLEGLRAERSAASSSQSTPQSSSASDEAARVPAPTQAGGWARALVREWAPRIGVHLEATGTVRAEFAPRDFGSGPAETEPAETESAETEPAPSENPSGTARPHGTFAVVLNDPRVTLDATGATLRATSMDLGTTDLTAHLEGLEAKVPDLSRPDRLRVTAHQTTHQGLALGLVAERTGPRSGMLRLLDGHGGTLEFRAEPSPTATSPEHLLPSGEPAAFVLSLWAGGFEATGLGALVGGRLPLDLDLHEVTIDGRASAAFTHRRSFTAKFESLELSPLRVSHPALAKRSLRLRPLRVSGTASRSEGTDQLDLSISHGPVTFEVAGTRRGADLAFSASFPETPCQVLFEALPEGFLSTLAGMRFEGTTHGRIAFELEGDALARYARSLRALPWQVAPEASPETPPGRIALDLPIFERCRVPRDAPGIDFTRLRTRYTHRFVDDDGLLRERILAAGHPGFARLSSVPLLANAFVTLEDARFASHHGFDPEQIERALWYNLARREVTRGASTISQQTARNLWLGQDRAFGRKLQEALLTWRLEAELPKERILEIYLNIIELGPSVYGVTEAADYHFSKRPEQLSVLEALHLAALAPAPRTLSARFAAEGIPATWLAHLREQARRMRLRGFLSSERLQEAERGTLELSRQDRHDRPDPS